MTGVLQFVLVLHCFDHRKNAPTSYASLSEKVFFFHSLLFLHLKPKCSLAVSVRLQMLIKSFEGQLSTIKGLFVSGQRNPSDLKVTNADIGEFTKRKKVDKTALLSIFVATQETSRIFRFTVMADFQVKLVIIQCNSMSHPPTRPHAEAELVTNISRLCVVYGITPNSGNIIYILEHRVITDFMMGTDLPIWNLSSFLNEIRGILTM